MDGGFGVSVFRSKGRKSRRRRRPTDPPSKRREGKRANGAGSKIDVRKRERKKRRFQMGSVNE